MTVRLFTHGKDGCTELLALDFEVVNNSGKQRCAKGSKSGTKLFLDTDLDEVRVHEIVTTSSTLSSARSRKKPVMVA